MAKINDSILAAEQIYAAALSEVTDDRTIVIADADGKDISQDVYKEVWKVVAPDIDFEVGERAHIARENARAGLGLAFGRRANQYHKANEESKLITGSFGTGKNASVDLTSERYNRTDSKLNGKETVTETYGKLTIRSRQTYSQNSAQPYNGVRQTVHAEAKELFGNVAEAMND